MAIAAHMTIAIAHVTIAAHHVAIAIHMTIAAHHVAVISLTVGAVSAALLI